MSVALDKTFNESTDHDAAKGISRRGFLGTFGAAAAVAVVASLPLGNDAEAAPKLTIENIQDAYPAEQRNGYTYIKMDRVAPGGSSVTDVNLLKLSYAKRNDPANDPLVIVNYGYDGSKNIYGKTYKASEAQRAFFEKALPVLADQSTRPLVFIDVTALGLNEAQKAPQAVHFASLLDSLATNTLGRGRTPHVFQSGNYILPYAQVEADGQKLYDFSFAKYSNKIPLQNVQGHIAKNLISAVTSSNSQVVASAEGPNLSLAQSN